MYELVTQNRRIKRARLEKNGMNGGGGAAASELSLPALTSVTSCMTLSRLAESSLMLYCLRWGEGKKSETQGGQG